jgi:lipopolysaccharide transport system permease protein
MTPVALLSIYGIVFGVVLKVRWPSLPDGTPVGFIVPFFCGLSVYLFFSDIVSSSSSVFNSKRNFVKKSPFPLWVLWLSNFLRACIQSGVYIIVTLFVAAVIGVLTFIGLLYALATIVPLIAFCAALSLILSLLSPFLGDINEAVRVVLRLMFYGAPVTYPLAIVPEKWQFLFWLNPLTHMIEPLRDAVVYGQLMFPAQLVIFAVVTIVVMFGAIWLFARVESAVPDVI